MSRQLEPYQLIERSIQKKFHKVLWTPFITAIKQYELIAPGDRIAVCISGGKDSMLMAKLLQLLQRHSDVPFEVVDLVMDPGYNAVNRQKIESNAALLHIPVTIFETNIFDVTSGIEQSPCYLCARMRRGYLYSKARELGCNKIALGHHFSDVVETTVMGMFYGSQLQAMPPKLRSRNFPGMELIRPMYCIHEDDIIAWQRYNGLEFIQCACRFTEHAAAHGNDGSSSKRQEVKLLLRELRRTNPDIEKSIFHSIHSVCLDTMVGYKSGGVEHTFADCYRAGERRDKAGQRALLADSAYQIDILRAPSGGVQALMASWDFGGFVFFEHFAVDPACRNGGIGGQMLDALLARFDKPACLEAELPETELAARRIGFYERHGFTVNADYPYFQPALTPGGSPIPLHLLTTGGARTPAELRAIETLVHTRVYGKTPAAMV